MQRPRTELRRISRDAGIVAIDGYLPPGWCGNLAAALARRQVSIERGFAVRREAGRWQAEFELWARGGPDLAALDFVALARTDAGAGLRTAVVIDEYHLAQTPDHGGSLRLDLAGEDCLGYLAAVLRRLAYFSLFPAELRLDTIGERVKDSLWLLGSGGRRPSPRAREALANALESLLAGRIARRALEDEP